MKKLAPSLVFIVVAVGVAAAMSVHKLSDSQTAEKGSVGTLTNSPSSALVVVNKQRPLNPKTYAPADLKVPNIPLRSNITDEEKQVSGVITPSLEAMVAAASEQGISINLQSGYRSYAFQAKLHDEYEMQQGQAVADSQSAQAGYSEHQTGLAVDLGDVSNPSCDVRNCFATTSAGKWLTADAYKYGFILRYPLGKQSITGYTYEPWHFRYVGDKLAKSMRTNRVNTLEQYFNVQ